MEWVAISCEAAVLVSLFLSKIYRKQVPITIYRSIDLLCPWKLKYKGTQNLSPRFSDTTELLCRTLQIDTLPTVNDSVTIGPGHGYRAISVLKFSCWKKTEESTHTQLRGTVCLNRYEIQNSKINIEQKILHRVCRLLSGRFAKLLQVLFY